MRAVFYYFFRLYLIFISLFRLIFFFFYFSAVKRLIQKLFAAVFAYYKDTTIKLADFRQSNFYEKRKDKLCWCQVSILSNSWGNIDGLEITFLSTIVSEIKPKIIFEFGTYNGFTTVHLSKNALEECIIYTIDLPQSNTFNDMKRLSLTQGYDDIITAKMAKDLGIGYLFTQSGKFKNIIQLFGDTSTYNFSQWHKKVDLCFIDACHSYQYVKSDTENAFKMLSESGILVWHDFDIYHYDVFRYLNQMAKNKKLFYIENTRLAVYFNS